MLSEGSAQTLAADLLVSEQKGDRAALRLPLAYLTIEPGDDVRLSGNETVWHVDEMDDTGLIRTLSISEYVGHQMSAAATSVSDAPVSASIYAVPELLVIDALESVPLVAAAASPWPGVVSVRAGTDLSRLSERAELTVPSSIGRVQSDIPVHPIGRWDRARHLVIYMPHANLQSETEAAVLAGANRLLVETDDGWELIAFQSAELVGEDTYRLSGFLRGLRGTGPGHVSAGAICVMLDDAVKLASIGNEEIGADLIWRTHSAEDLGPVQTYSFEVRGSLAYRPGHLRAHWIGADLHLKWTRRGSDVPESWSLPEAENAGRFQIELYGDGGLRLGSWVSDQASFTIAEPGDVKEVRVAEIGADGRSGAEGVLLIQDALA